MTDSQEQPAEAGPAARAALVAELEDLAALSQLVHGLHYVSRFVCPIMLLGLILALAFPGFVILRPTPGGIVAVVIALLFPVLRRQDARLQRRLIAVRRALVEEGEDQAE